uniref:Uncharacterized protein n=1 Tax=Meloidogyne enterolobii TaxID=390850 RepID=A0A6V7W0V0_MELEN|nr:unnamed protein product [Meloidogyne enterolobii]
MANHLQTSLFFGCCSLYSKSLRMCLFHVVLICVFRIIPNCNSFGSGCMVA